MNRLLILVLLGLSFLFSACEKKEEFVTPQTGTEGAKPESSDAKMPVEDTAKQMRDEFASKMQQDMDELNAKLAELRTRALTLTGKAREKIDQQIHRLEQEQKTAAQKFDALKSATGEQWNAMKSGVADAVEHFKQSVKKAREENKK